METMGAPLGIPGGPSNHETNRSPGEGKGSISPTERRTSFPVGSKDQIDKDFTLLQAYAQGEQRLPTVDSLLGAKYFKASKRVVSYCQQVFEKTGVAELILNGQPRLWITNLDKPYRGNLHTPPRIDIELVQTEQPDTPAHMSLVLTEKSKEALEQMVNEYRSGISQNEWRFDVYETGEYLHKGPIYRATRRVDAEVDTEIFPRLANWLRYKLGTALQETRKRIITEGTGGKDEETLAKELKVFEAFLAATRGEVRVAEVSTEQPSRRKEHVRRDSLTIAEEVRQDSGAYMPGSVTIQRLLEWDSLQPNQADDPFLKKWDKRMRDLDSSSEDTGILKPLRAIQRHNLALPVGSLGLWTVEAIRSLTKKGLLDLDITNLGDMGAGVVSILFAPIEESQKESL